MKKLLLTLTLVVCIMAFASAQDYKTGIGLRGGLYNGLTIKHFISSKTALEGLLATRWSGFEITGLYEISNRAFDVERLNWYFGLGGHVGFYNGNNTTWGDAGKSYTVIGLDGILGLEYNFSEVPINISADWKPAFNIIGYSKFWGDGGALSIRYIF
jgi:opacity protein-like surface antigen